VTKLAAALPLVLALARPSLAEAQLTVPKITVEAGNGQTPQDASAAVQIMVVLTLLTLAPAILMMLTSFTRVVIVLSFLRQAIGVQQLPPNQVILGLSLFLTVFVMAPVGQQMHQVALQPYLDRKISQSEAVSRGLEPLRTFMLRQTRERDLGLMAQLGKIPPPKTPADLPTHVLIPAFALSEVKTAFQMGFVLFVPFLIIDLVVASVLMSMGMMMLPPVVISVPAKLLLFVLADGWHLVVRALVASYQ
jgi:flagellar biosynthetic protein FliP